MYVCEGNKSVIPNGESFIQWPVLPTMSIQKQTKHDGLFLTHSTLQSQKKVTLSHIFLTKKHIFLLLLLWEWFKSHFDLNWKEKPKESSETSTASLQNDQRKEEHSTKSTTGITESEKDKKEKEKEKSKEENHKSESSVDENEEFNPEDGEDAAAVESSHSRKRKYKDESEEKSQSNEESENESEHLQHISKKTKTEETSSILPSSNEQPSKEELQVESTKTENDPYASLSYEERVKIFKVIIFFWTSSKNNIHTTLTHSLTHSFDIHRICCERKMSHTLQRGRKCYPFSFMILVLKVHFLWDSVKCLFYVLVLSWFSDWNSLFAC